MLSEPRQAQRSRPDQENHSTKLTNSCATKSGCLEPLSFVFNIYLAALGLSCDMRDLPTFVAASGTVS